MEVQPVEFDNLLTEQDPELQVQCDGNAAGFRRQRAGVAAAGLGALALAGAAALLWSGPHWGPKAADTFAAQTLNKQPAAPACTSGRGDCKESQCCASPGYQCYEQDETYAQCRATCTAGPDPTHWDGKSWTCRELGARTAGEPWCVKPGQDCRTSHCCADPGLQCYEKNASWATCKESCWAGAPDLSDVDSYPWTCKELGERTPTTQPWVASQCSSGWDDCVTTKCCKNQGEQCFLQNDYFGECKTQGSCPGGWSCGTAGSVTPAPALKGGKLPAWALEKCSKADEGCTKSRCCLGMDVQCYEKDASWAQCKSSCTPGAHADDNNSTWSCKELGPRSYGLATKGFPSLFCFSVFRTDGYEVGLMAAQKEQSAGIFACDDFSLLTADGTTNVGGIQTIQFPGAPIVRSIDNTAGNTELFVNAWNALMNEGKWKNHAFVVKVDPDAVFVPDRLRWHVQSYVGQKMFVINCHVGDMVYGALEVFSYHAILDWSINGNSCDHPNNYGEDLYMTRCMDHLGAIRVHDEAIMGDKLCGTFSDCANGWNSAFHPFKDAGAWLQCWNQANNLGAGPGR